MTSTDCHRCRCVPAGLQEVRALVSCLRPRAGAGPREWVEFHRFSALAYAKVAKIDATRRVEATQWVMVEIRKARDIEHAATSGECAQ